MNRLTTRRTRFTIFVLCLTTAFAVSTAPTALGQSKDDTVRHQKERLAELVAFLGRAEVTHENHGDIVSACDEIEKLIPPLVADTPLSQTLTPYLEAAMLCKEKETERFRTAAWHRGKFGRKFNIDFLGDRGMPHVDRKRILTPEEERLFRGLRQTYWDRLDAYLACVAAFPNRNNRSWVLSSLSHYLARTPNLSDDTEAYTRHTIELIERFERQIDQGQDPERAWDWATIGLRQHIPYRKNDNSERLRFSRETTAPLTRWLIEHPHPSLRILGLHQKVAFATGDDATDAAREILDTLFPMAPQGHRFGSYGRGKFESPALYAAIKRLNKEQLNDWYNRLLDHVIQTKDARALLAYPMATEKLIKALDPPLRGIPAKLPPGREDLRIVMTRMAGDRIANAAIILTCLRNYPAEGPPEQLSATLQSRLERDVQEEIARSDANTGGSSPWKDGSVTWTNLIPPESLGVWRWGTPWRLFKSAPGTPLPVTVVFSDQNIRTRGEPEREVLRLVMARMSVDGQTFRKIAETSIPAGRFGIRRHHVASDGKRCAVLVPNGEIRLLSDDGIVVISPTGPGGQELLSTGITCLNGTFLAYGEQHLSKIDLIEHRLAPILGPNTQPQVPGVAPGTQIGVGNPHGAEPDVHNGLLWTNLTAPKPGASTPERIGYFAVDPKERIRPLPDLKQLGSIRHHRGKTYVTQRRKLFDFDLDTWSYVANDSPNQSHPRYVDQKGKSVPLWKGRPFGEYLLTDDSQTFYLSTRSGKCYGYGFPPGGMIHDQLLLDDQTLICIGGGVLLRDFEILKRTQTQLHVITLRDGESPQAAPRSDRK